MQIAFATDHAGFCQKSALIAYLHEQRHEVLDLGPFRETRCDYPDFADKVARSVASGQADRGVLVCGTGIGMALAADKVAGIRAAAIQTPEFARLFREHNDGNIICLSGRFVSLATNEAILDVFLSTAFAGERHTVRVEKIMRSDSPDFLGVSQDFDPTV